MIHQLISNFMTKKNFITFPEFNTCRLKLRQLKISDNEEIYEIRSDTDIAKYLDRPLCKSIEEADAFINKINNLITTNACFYWAVTLIDSDLLIGTICLWNFSDDNHSAEIGFELLKEWQGKGYMQESVSEVLEFGFTEIKLKQIIGEVDPGNIKSIKVLKKNNFILKENDPEDTSSPTVKYILNSDNYKGRKNTLFSLL